MQEIWVSRLNPVAKLVLVLSLGLSAVASPSLLLVAGMIALLTIVAAFSRMLVPFLKVMAGFGVPITLMLLLIQGCYSPSNVTFIADFGFARLGLEGVRYALKTVETLLVFLGGLYIMKQTTNNSELVAALVERGLSPKMGYLVLASLNVVPQMQRRMTTIKEAQSARGLSTGGGFASRIRATIPLLGPVVMSSLTDTQERGAVLETHGFGLSDVRHTSYVEVHHSHADKVVILVGLIVLVMTVAFAALSSAGLVGSWR